MRSASVRRNSVFESRSPRQHVEGFREPVEPVTGQNSVRVLAGSMSWVLLLVACYNSGARPGDRVASDCAAVFQAEDPSPGRDFESRLRSRALGIERVTVKHRVRKVHLAEARLATVVPRLMWLTDSPPRSTRCAASSSAFPREIPAVGGPGGIQMQHCGFIVRVENSTCRFGHRSAGRCRYSTPTSNSSNQRPRCTTSLVQLRLRSVTVPLPCRST